MSGFYRLLLTGSRDVTGADLWLPGIGPDDALADVGAHTLADLLDAVTLSATRSGYAGLTLVHGACPRGVDAIGHRWACTRRNRGWPVVAEPHPADWATGGRRAGFSRNEAMVGEGANACYAFIAPCRSSRCRRPEPHGSHGSTHCTEAAARAGIPVQRFEPARVDAGSLPNERR